MKIKTSKNDYYFFVKKEIVKKENALVAIRLNFVAIMTFVNGMNIEARWIKSSALRYVRKNNNLFKSFQLKSEGNVSYMKIHSQLKSKVKALQLWNL